MIRLLALSIAFCIATSTSGEPFYTAAPTFSRPHPAVVRIAAPERDGASYGSGTLVAVNESSGLVLTNWHVVRDAAGKIVVYFPDGFYSGAYLLRTDRDWDLAALAIRRPNAAPIAISSEVPQPGDELTIAGYGSGSYRAVTGRLTQYVSPGGNQPFEMLELSAPARNGDSGGPILNRRGELAGTLFGTAFGRTTGSYCGRLRWFLNLVEGDFQRISTQAMLAQQSRQTSPPLASINSSPLPLKDGPVEEASSGNISPISARPQVGEAPGAGSSNDMVSLETLPRPAVSANSTPSLKLASAPSASIPAPPAGLVPRNDQLRSILALIGAVSILYCSLRFLGWAVG